jgi:6-phosphofructo-2-kinase
MRLKLAGPDYKNAADPLAALADFKERVVMYEKAYVPLGDYEERNDMPYIKACRSHLLPHAPRLTTPSTSR